jgi:hypothetical protein
MYKFFVQATLIISMAISPFLAFPLEKPIEGTKVSGVAQTLRLPTQQVNADTLSFVDLPSAWESQPAPSPAHTFGNPAGCAASAPTQSPVEMLENVQAQLPELDLASRRLGYIYNGTLDSMVSVGDDPFVYEFSVNLYQSPFTYLADQTVTVFLQNGFVVWLRNYGGHFRLTAIPMVDGVYESRWGEYISAYWSTGLPNDKYLYPVMKKLPCHWMIDEGWVSDETIGNMFDLDWQIPDYLTDGRKYLASNCEEANRISQEQIGFWDAASMCGPLAWTLIKNANSFPYRIGSWYASAHIFEDANPKWNGRPWAGFDPETYDVIHTDSPMPGYDFAENGNMEKGDIIYSYSTLYASNDERFDHIFLVADVNQKGERISISNMVQNKPEWDCFIQEVVLYTPSDLVDGVINKQWNSFENGRTGVMGFDIFRWKWITYHLDGLPVSYTVRIGDTLETIAFDWKVSPQEVAAYNQISIKSQLTPGQIITLPALLSSL